MHDYIVLVTGATTPTPGSPWETCGGRHTHTHEQIHWETCGGRLTQTHGQIHWEMCGGRLTQTHGQTHWEMCGGRLTQTHEQTHGQTPHGETLDENQCPPTQEKIFVPETAFCFLFVTF